MLINTALIVPIMFFMVPARSGRNFLALPSANWELGFIRAHSPTR